MIDEGPQTREDARAALRVSISRLVAEVMGVAPRDDGEPLDIEQARGLVELALERVVEQLSVEPTAELGRLVMSLHELLRELDANARSERLDALSNVHDGLSRLRGLGSLARLIDAATVEACRGCGFDRAWLLRVEEGELCVESAAADGEWLDVSEPLVPGSIEAEVVRQRSAILVSDPERDERVTGALARARGPQPFVAVPICAEGRVAGILEADRALTGRRLERLDRDTLSAFADGLGYAIERAVLFERLCAHRTHVRDLVQATEAVATELCDAQVRLARTDHRTAELGTVTTSLLTPGITELLSPREIEVVEAVASGASNAEIATRLYITEDTVKSHVKRILRKLGASNRVEAVTRYLRLTAQR